MNEAASLPVMNLRLAEEEREKQKGTHEVGRRKITTVKSHKATANQHFLGTARNPEIDKLRWVVFTGISGMVLHRTGGAEPGMVR
jgi:hypothetical protein